MISVDNNNENKVKNQTKCAQYNCSLTDTKPYPQTLIGLSGQLPCFRYWTWLCMVWNKPLASSGHLSQLCFLRVFCPSSHWQSMRHWKTLWFRVRTIDNNQNINVLSMLLSHWIQKAALYQLLRLTLSQPKARWG